MKPTGSDRDFELWLERELRLNAASAQQHRPRITEPAYRAASRRGGRSLATRSGILAAVTRRGAAALVVAALAIGGGGVVAATATGNIDPGSLGQRVAQIVEGCKDQVRGEGRDKRPDADVDTHAPSADRQNHRGIGKCVSSQVNHHQNGAVQQQAHQDRDNGPQSGRSSSPGKSPDHGQGNGAGPLGAPPGQGGPPRGHGNGNPGDDGDHGHHGHPPTPSPRP